MTLLSYLRTISHSIHTPIHILFHPQFGKTTAKAATSIQGGRKISAIILSDDYLCYKEQKNPYNFFLILIINKLFKFKIPDEWQHRKTAIPTLGVEVQLAKWLAGNCKQNETGQTP